MDNLRLNRLRSYQILDTAREQEFDRITSLASNLFNVPISVISLVDRHRLWFKSAYGINISEVPSEKSFCKHCINNLPEVTVIPDARLDNEFNNSPLVISSPHIVFYAGAPLIDSEGFALGTLCIIDSMARQVDAKEQQILKDLAAIVVNQIEYRYLDRKLKEELEIKSQILKHIPSYVFLKDTENNIIFANDKAASALKLDQQEMAGKSTKEFYPELADDYYKDDLRVINSKAISLGIREKVGNTLVRTDKVPILNEHNEVRSILVVSTDITNEVEIEEVKKATFRKSQFLANISHEIRTPLTSIVSLAELLSESELPSVYKEDVRDILGSALHLKDLIGDVLDFSKIEAGELTLIEQEVSTEKLISSLQRDFKRIADTRNQIIQLENKSTLPKFLLLDSGRLRQILYNLFSNASKFSPPNSNIKMRISNQNEFIVFEVEDNGIGIPPELCLKIFEPYVQIDSSLSRQAEGIGLGLPISSELAKLMNGSLSVISDGESGSTFTLKIPIRECDSAELDEEKQIMPFRGKKVLLAEDNIINRIAMKRILGSLGIEVDEAIDGEDVFKHLDNSNYDLLLLDIHMPKLNGLEVLDKLRNENLYNGHVAMLTACATKEERNKALSLGSVAFFTKPVERQNLSVKLSEIWGKL
jgi:PAS domain S-box-containing protein